MGTSRKQLLAYLALGIVVVAIGARVLVTHRGGPAEAGMVVSLGGSSPAASASPSLSPSAAPTLMVDVAGEVRRPGVYTLPAGARVCDAIDLAGGVTGKAQLTAVNLAARLVDGQQVVVPSRGAVVTPGQTGTGSGTVSGGPTSPVNINTATLEQLDALSGVGPATAQKIIAYREANGGFKSIEEIKNVPGIGDAKFEALKGSITV